MYQLRLAVAVWLGFLVCNFTTALLCIPCSDVKCETPICRGGFVKDACNCCKTCAKTVGEKCGGPYDMSGVCDKGLKCKKVLPKNVFPLTAVGKCVPVCGPVCHIFCPHGNVLDAHGCPTCKCKDEPHVLK